MCAFNHIILISSVNVVGSQIIYLNSEQLIIGNVWRALSYSLKHSTEKPVIPETEGCYTGDGSTYSTERPCQRLSVGKNVSSGHPWFLIAIKRLHRHIPKCKVKQTRNHNPITLCLILMITTWDGCNVYVPLVVKASCGGPERVKVQEES